MNHSRRQRRTWYPSSSLVAALTFIAGCGGNGGASTEVGAAGGVSKPKANAAAPRGVATPETTTHGSVTIVGDPEELTPQPFGPPVKPFFLCQHDPIAFDLSKLSAAGTPLKFQLAWELVQRRAEIPGMVVAYSGTRNGPQITMRVGSVTHASAGELGFQKTLPGSRPVTMDLSPTDPFRLRSPDVEGVFFTAFGLFREREGFMATSVMVDGRLDAGCQTLNAVTVDLTLPFAGNAKRPFGNSTLEEELGPPTRDTDRDGNPDSWTLTLTGPSLEAMDFKL